MTQPVSRHPRGPLLAVLVLTLALVLTACSTGERAADPAGPRTRHRVAHAPSGSASSPPAPSKAPTPSEQPPAAGPEQLPIGLGWGPTRDEIAHARRLVAQMSLRQRAGQVIVASYSGTQPPTRLVNGLHLGGVIVMADNISSLDQLRRGNRAIQRTAAAAGRKWPVFVGVDQEGGIVARVQDDATRFPAFMTAGAADRPRLTTRAAAASGAELRDLGFTVDFAPDGDVTSGPADPTIGSRSAGSDPDLVARQMNAAVDGYLSSGILPVIKHFPGHGSVPADSHLTLPVQHKSMRDLMDSDLVPFKAGVADGISAVMVAHIDVRSLDPGVPSSLSRKAVTGLLRKRLGFQGLAVTDALNMGAITGRYGVAESAVRALRAGEDVLLMPPRPRLARDAIVAAVRAGRLSRARLAQAAGRQIAMLLHQEHLDTTSRSAGSSRPTSRALSAAGVTVVQGRCSWPLVGPSVRVRGPASAVAAFEAAAARAGLHIGSGPEVALIGYGGGPQRADVVVAMDTPYVLGRSRASTAKIATYGETPGAMGALVDVLVGRAKAPGRLPVPVAGVPRSGC